MLFLSDAYFEWLAKTYSILVFFIIPSAIIFSLKMWAILSPKAPANAIIELIQSMWPSGRK